MKITDTISVNPSKTTLGHVDTHTNTIFRSQVLGSEVTSGSIDIMKIIFPSSCSGSLEFRKFEVPLRTLFASILIVTGLSLLQASISIGFAVCTLVFGALLAVGFLTRPVMIGAAVYYCITGALSIRSGQIELSTFALMFGTLIFAVCGGGKYSIDTLIRGLINRRKQREKAAKEENFLGYKAFHKVRF